MLFKLNMGRKIMKIKLFWSIGLLLICSNSIQTMNKPKSKKKAGSSAQTTEQMPESTHAVAAQSPDPKDHHVNLAPTTAKNEPIKLAAKPDESKQKAELKI